MSLFGNTSNYGASTYFGTTGSVNPMKDIEVTSPPEDSISSLEFSPGTLPSTFLVAGSWDNNVSYIDHLKFSLFVFAILRGHRFWLSVGAMLGSSTEWPDGS